MEIGDWQCNWPLRFWSWPWYNESYDEDFKITCWAGGFGPFQFRGYK